MKKSDPIPYEELQDQELIETKYTGQQGAHASCAFCNHLFEDGKWQDVYETKDGKYLICKDCYQKLKEQYHFTLEEWRLFRGQEEYLKGRKLTRARYTTAEYGDHDHCEFCFKNFMEHSDGIEYCTSTGYITDGGHWICEECYQDFKERFAWKMQKKEK